jgi:glycerol-3-phosphate dehydrogenase (NAD(P)+)
MDVKKMKITVLGTGAFGTAIANEVVKNVKFTQIYGIDQKEIDDINENHKNSKYFSSAKLQSNLIATNNPSDFIDTDVFIIGLPSQVIPSVIEETVVPNMTKPAYFINLSKGIDYINLETIAKTIKKIVPKELNLGNLKLAGGSFADDIVAGQPTLFTLAANNLEIAVKLKEVFITNVIRVEPSSKLEETEMLSAIKNPLAIFLGIIKGLGYQDNAISAAFYQSVKTMKQIMSAMDLDPSTVISPAGIEDLYLTGSSMKSRNYSVGYAIGKHNKVNKKVLTKFQTIEGLRVLEKLLTLLKQNNIRSDILLVVYNITYKNEVPSKTVERYFEKLK